MVITGAGRGIGRAYALELSRRGARVVVNDVSEGPACSVVDEIASSGGAAIPVVADVTDQAACADLILRATNAFGAIDALICNASINSKRKPFTALTVADLRAMLDVNVLGAWMLLQAAWPHLSAHARGRILITTSQAGLYGMPQLAEYAVAKAALVGLVRTLAHEGAPAGVKVNAIAPAAVTRLTEETVKDERVLAMLRELQPPELVAPVAALLVHDACPFSGEMFVAGGAHMGRVFIGETKGVTLPKAEFTSEALFDRLESVCDEAGYKTPRDISETGDAKQKSEIFRRLRELGLVS
ncbi:MAG TPA: SDR family oxidoreductase [Caulobacterales bacterium]|nr:SDR family oxidoreductase [Caulobacterales bacterium]